MERDRIVVRIRERVRLDVFLTSHLAHVSRNRIQRHIERGDVLVDGRSVRPSHVLSGGEVLTLPLLESRRLEQASEPVEFAVVYEDEDIVVVDKPAGVLVHPVGKDFRRTLLNGLHRRLVDHGEDASELGIVHRLDRLTSGLLVVAKRMAARRALSLAVAMNENETMTAGEAREMIATVSSLAEKQSFAHGADAPRCVAMLGRIDDMLGALERRLPDDAVAIPCAIVGEVLKEVRRILRAHKKATREESNRVYQQTVREHDPFGKLPSAR